jgi:hypothetical protein
VTHPRPGDETSKEPIGLAIEPVSAADPDAAPIDDYVFLTGRPPLRQYLDFVKTNGVDGQGADRRRLVETWQAARRQIRLLEEQERGCADDAPIEPLSGRLEPLRRELLRDPLFQNAFSLVPTDVGMVELDRLVVYQKRVNLAYVEALKRRLGPSPGDEAIFRTCLPFDHPQPPVRWLRAHRNVYVFVSPSNDLRFLGPMSLEPAQVVGYPPPGAVARVLGLAVGFGSNFLNAIHVEGRLVLNNGSHRAVALHALGVTRVPCVIQHAASREDLALISSSDLARAPDQYLRHPRPSLLKDYLDPRLGAIIRVPRRARQVRVKIDIEETDVPVV